MKKTLRLAALVLAAAAVLGLTGCPGRVEKHEHTFATSWTSDATHHWHAATCEHPEETADKATHTFDEWKDGKKTCSVCKYEIICEHTFGEWNEGKRVCDLCDYEQTCTHTFEAETVTVQPTEEAEGKLEHTCKVCGTTEKVTLTKLDHVHAKGMFHQTVASTCVTNGTVAYYDCAKSTCLVKLDKDGNPLATIEAELDPANHEGTATTWTKTAATHKETYECCNAVKTAESAHTWDEGVVTKAATVSEEGVKTYTCNVCKATKTEAIEKLPAPSYNWYESPVDAVTGLAATSSSIYVYFGVFPKTVLPLDSTVTVYENDKVEMGANTYYKGSDGEFYAKALENAYGTGAEYKYKNKVEQAKQKSAGSYRYFKVEPIMWKVLTTNYNGTGKALLLAEDILTANIPYFESTSNRTIDGKTVYANNYKHSQIRAYLNGLTYQGQSGEVEKWNGKGFLQAAFTETAQSRIVTTAVDNSAASTTDAGNNLSQSTSWACENTSDKIFLLSEKEVTTTAYGFAAYDSSGQGNARIRKPTDYAKASYASQNSTTGYGGYWWLRSPNYSNGYDPRSVGSGGHANSRSNVSHTDRGGVPALSISF